jgi:hypothetical protein
MRRREFITLVGGGSCVAARGALAAVLGVGSLDDYGPYLAAFRKTPNVFS